MKIKYNYKLHTLWKYVFINNKSGNNSREMNCLLNIIFIINVYIWNWKQIKNSSMMTCDLLNTLINHNNNINHIISNKNVF